MSELCQPLVVSDDVDRWFVVGKQRIGFDDRSFGDELTNLVDESSEAAFPKQFRQSVGVDLTGSRFVPVEVEFKLRVQFDKLAADASLFGIRLEILLKLLSLRLVCVSQDVFKRSEFVEQGTGFFRSDERDSRNVVDFVADEGLEVDHLVRADAPVSKQVRLVEKSIFADVVQPDQRANELPRVFVARDDVCLDAFRF